MTILVRAWSITILIYNLYQAGRCLENKIHQTLNEKKMYFMTIDGIDLASNGKLYILAQRAIYALRFLRQGYLSWYAQTLIRAYLSFSMGTIHAQWILLTATLFSQ